MSTRAFRGTFVAPVAVLLMGVCFDDAVALKPESAATAFSIVSAEVPRILPAGSQLSLEVKLRNEGTSVWKKDGLIRLTYRWTKGKAEHTAETGRRIRIGKTVRPGQEIKVRIPFQAPNDLGLHQLRWRLVTRGQGIFSPVNESDHQPSHVLIAPNLEYLFGWILPFAACGLALVATARGRKVTPSSALRDLASVSLILWGAVSIFGKPFLLYHDLEVHIEGKGVLIGASVAAFCALALLPWGQRLRAGLTWMAVTFGALLVWANILYARFFGDVLASGALQASRQAGALMESILALAQPRDFLLLPDLILGLVLVALSMTSVPPMKRVWGRKLKAATAVLLAVAAAPAFVLSVQAADSKMGTGRRNLQTIRSVQQLGLHGFELQDIWTRVIRHWRSSQLSAEETENLVSWFVGTAPDRSGSSEWFGAAEGMNLVMVQVEALQQFVIGLEVAGQEVTPNLNRLFQSGLWFSRVQSQIGQGRSSAADFIFNTSLLPVADSIAYEYPSNHYRTIARSLGEKGYQTIAAIPFKKFFWNRHVTFPAYGYSNNLFKEDFAPGEKIGWGLNDRDFLHQMLLRLGQEPEPFCAWLLPLALHHPYSSFPEQHKVLDLGSYEGSSYGNYLHGMSFADRAFAAFFQDLTTSALGSRTVVVLWGDHGSGLRRGKIPETKVFADNSNLNQLLRNRVPVAIWVPDRERQAQQIDIQAGQIDFAPTLLALLGVDPQPLAFLGRNLLNSPRAKPIVHPHGNWLTDDLAYLSKGKSFEEGACFGVKSMQRISVAKCQSANRQAVRELEISSQLLAHDLQDDISKQLAVRLSELQGSR